MELIRKPVAQCATVGEMLRTEQALRQVTAVASKSINPRRLITVLPVAFKNNPLLRECNPVSFLGGIMTASSLGLMPNTATGECYLVPFRNGKASKEQKRDVYDVQLIIGYKGWLKLARRSGGLISVHADIATVEEFEGQHPRTGEPLFDWRYGSEMYLQHFNLHSKGTPAYAYAHAQLDGGQAFVVWPYADVMEHRDRFSQAYNQAKRSAQRPNMEWVLRETPWVKHEAAMVRKTMILRLVPNLDLTADAEDAMRVDERQVDFQGFALASSLLPGDMPEELSDEPADEPEESVIEDAETIEEQKPVEVKTTKADKTPQKTAQARKSDPPKGKGHKTAESPSQDDDSGSNDLFGGDDGGQEPAIDPHKALADSIIEQISEASEPNDVSEVLSKFDAELGKMEDDAPDEYMRVDEAATQAFDRFSGTEAGQ